MGLVLQLVKRGADTRGCEVDLLEIDQPRDLRDIANLGLTLPEAKQILARVQQAVVAAQARDHALLRPECSSCEARCHVIEAARVILGTDPTRGTMYQPYGS